MLTRQTIAGALRALLRPGFAIVIGAAVCFALHLWISRSLFLPIYRNGVVEYVFVSTTTASAVAVSAASFAAVFAVHALVRRLAAKRQPPPPLFSMRDAGYLSPVCCFAASTLPLLNLWPPVGPYLTLPSYVILDLRWWWRALVLVWLARNLYDRLHVSGAGLAGVRLPPALHRIGTELALAAVVTAWTVGGTPFLRDYGGVNGDEPKYVRYCENWYQGLGFDISNIKAMSQLPRDFQPRVWHNFTLLAEILPGELRGLGSDLVELVRDPSRRFNVAVHRDGGFLDGKSGGGYQVHNPGVSLLMFPAYYVDRRFALVQPESPAQWPDRLPTVNAFFVAVYAAWTILIFRFLLKCGSTTCVAWIAALTFVMTLPAAAFPFQYYPEVAAGFFVSAIGTHLLFGDVRRPGLSFWFGLASGYLVWLHVRFAGVTVVLAVVPLFLWRSQYKRLAAFFCGLMIPATLFSLYAYRVTGSVIPSALWSAEGSGSNFAWIGVFKNSVAYLVDRDWGLFAHSPVFLLVLPGYWWLARRKPEVAALNALVFLALLIPSAGKTLVQTTPMRLLVAAIPFGATPLIETLERSTKTVRVAFALLLILSLDDALSYNLYHLRHYSTLVDWSVSGWKFNLMFPSQSRFPWQISVANGLLLVAWIAIVLALFCAPILMKSVGESPRGAVPHATTGRFVAPALAAAVLFVVLGTAVSAATGVWTLPDYTYPPNVSAARAALLVDALGGCNLCVSSKFGRMRTRRMLTSLEAVDASVAKRRLLDEWGYTQWLEMPGLIRAWYLEATGHEPANTDVGHFLYQWREERVPPAEIRRRIFGAAGKTS